MTTWDEATWEAARSMGAGRGGRPRILWRAAAVVAAMLGVAWLATLEGQADAAEPRDFLVGAVDTGAGPSVVVEDKSFSEVIDSFADLGDQVPLVRIPLPSVLGPEDLLIEDAELVVDEPRSSITIRGVSPDFLGATATDPADVLVLMDWIGSIGEKPTVVVSGQLPGRDLGGVLGLAGDALGDVGLDRVMHTVGSTEVPPSSTEHVSLPANLPDTARDFYESFYGPGLPTPHVPALETLGNLWVSTRTPLDGLPDVLGEALGWDDGSVAVLEGGLGIGYGNPFDPRQSTWQLSARVPANPLASLWPDWLQVDDAAWRVAIAWDAAAGRVGLTAEVNAIVDLLGDTRDVTVAATLDIDPTNPSLTSVALLAGINGVWPEPFGIPWLSLDQLAVTGEFERAIPEGETDPVTTFSGGVIGRATVAGKAVVVQVKGTLTGSSPSGTVEVRMDDSVTVGELVDVFDSVSPIDIPDEVPDELLATTIERPSLQVDVATTTSGRVTTVTVTGGIQFQVPLPVGEDLDLGATLLLAIGSDRSVTVGVRSNSDLSLSSLLPGVDIPADFDFTFASSDSGAFGFVFTRADIEKESADLPLPVRVFFRPLHGIGETDPSPFKLELPAGASVLAGFELPEGLAGIVETTGFQSWATVKGTVPIFSSQQGAQLEISLALRPPEEVPEVFHQVNGTIKLTGTGGAQSSIELAFEGDLFLKVRSGLPEDVAVRMADLHIPVGVDRVLADGDTCETGQPHFVSGDDGDRRCYDILKLTGKFGIEAAADGSVSLNINSQFTTLPSGATWYPFGLEWVGLDDARAVIKISVAVDGSVAVTLGFQGDVEFFGGDKDVLAAIQTKTTLMVEAPWIKVELEGIRLGSGEGFGTGDIIRLQSLLARAAGQGGTELDLGALDLPAISLRNLDVAFSPKPGGVPDLCIPEGLTLSADLYLNPSDDAPLVNPDCDNGEPTIPREEDRCIQRRVDGCLASGRLRVATDGIFGLFEIPGFDIGPIHMEDLEIDLAVALQDPHMIARAGLVIDNPLGIAPDPLASGRMRMKFRPLDFTIYGELDVFGFKALVDMTARYDILDAALPEFRLHVLLATDQYHISQPSFVSAAAARVADMINPLAAIADAADYAFGVAENGSLSDLVRLADRMEDAGVEVPGWLSELNSKAAGALSEFEDAIDFVGGNTFNLVMNGIPSFTVPEVCVDVGFTEVCVGGWGFDGFDGLCNTVFDGAEFDGMRDSDGDCHLDRLVRHLLLPAFEQAVAAIVDVGNLVFEEVVDALTGLDFTQSLLKLECGEVLVDVGGDPPVGYGDLRLVGSLFGQDFGFGFGFDFADPLGSLDDLVDEFIRQIVNPGSVDCIGFNHEVFVATPPVGGPVPRLTIDVPDDVDEGASFTLTGSFDVALTAARVIRVEWGDGQVDQVTVAEGQDGFTLDHAYPDDDPSVTRADQVEIVATDLSTGAGTSDPLHQVAAHVTVHNVAPTITSFTPLSAIEEGRSQEFRLEFDDPGIADSHRITVLWGDGHMSRPVVAVGQRTLTVAHTWRDDNPTGTPADPYTVRVFLDDDDLGSAARSFTHQVHNVAPHDVSIELLSERIEENAPAEFLVTWRDPGVADSHLVRIDWDDATPVHEETLSRGDRETRVTHTWGDNGIFEVEVLVVDDDTGVGTVTIPFEVHNLDPDVVIDRSPTFAAPGGDTFLVRVDTPLTVDSDTTDPGSDDLTYTWSWGDGLADVHLDRVNPPADDPLPSPSIQPRDVALAMTHVYGLNCLYTLDLTVVDDDAGSDTDLAPVVVVGDEDKTRPRGWWYEEYLHFGNGSPSTKIDDRTKQCLLDIATHMGSVFGEVVPLATPADAVEVLHPSSMTDITRFDRELLALWLNWGQGAVGTDADGYTTPEFAQLVYDAERVRLDPDATRKQLHDAQKQLEWALRNL